MRGHYSTLSDWQADDKTAALAGFALSADGAAVALGDLAADRQANAAALKFAAPV